MGWEFPLSYMANTLTDASFNKEKEVKQMSKFTLFRTVCRIAGILSCVAALIGLNLHSTVLVLISVAVLAAT